MHNFIKQYNIRVKALSPIHIGGGENINKKMYISVPKQGLILVPDESLMYQDLVKLGKEKQYQDYILGNKNTDLGKWLELKNIEKKIYSKWTKYALNIKDVDIYALKNAKNIITFIKDAYSQPFVPGSGIKGMLRTALLAKAIVEESDSFKDITHMIIKELEEKKSPKSFLSGSTNSLEIKAFHKKNIIGIDKRNALNSLMSGIIVSDSDPISIDSLILCQKIDYSIDGKERKIPILREAIKPGTDVYFRITIDETKCPYTIQDINSAINIFQSIVTRYFYDKFGREEKEKNIVWIGGGVGFLSKTIIYPLFEEDGVIVADKIFRNNLGKNYFQHKHNSDIRNNISPHICKCTRFNGKLYNMGVGKFEIL